MSAGEMDKLLARLERHFGGFALPGLAVYHVGIMGLMLVAAQTMPHLAERLVLIPEKVLAGEVWRLFSYMIMPPSFELLWGFLGLYFYHMVATQLEAQWGSFKFQVFLFTGMVFNTVVAMVTGFPTTNTYVLMSLFLAFATLWPDFEILMFLIIPVKVKWLALLDGLLLVFMTVTSPGLSRLLPVMAVANYLLFFAPHLLGLLRGRALLAQRAREFQDFRTKAAQGRVASRLCSACGLTDVTDPKAEFRICTCEKCGKPTEFCLEHARSH